MRRSYSLMPVAVLPLSLLTGLIIQLALAGRHKEAMGSFIVSLGVDAKTIPLGGGLHEPVKGRQVVLVTGGTMGIGLASALAYGRAGAATVLTAPMAKATAAPAAMPTRTTPQVPATKTVLASISPALPTGRPVWALAAST